jgi:hypothetical protein
MVLSFFLGLYKMLLFTFTYLFSDLKKTKAQLFSIGFGTASLIAGVASLLEPLQDQVTPFRVGAFFGLTILCFVTAAYEQKTADNKKTKWHIAIQPPALFLLMFIFFNILHFEGTLDLWFPYLLNIFGASFAILIVLHISQLFNWKYTCIFAALLTLIDIILVFSGPMVVAAQTFSRLGLPMLIYLPSVPLIPAENIFGFAFRGLGLGDFFFTGILAIQTFNRFGKKYAYASIISMVLSFGIWQTFLLDLLALFNLEGFPATVFVITGWIPIAVIGTLMRKKQPLPSSQTDLSDSTLQNSI